MCSLCDKTLCKTRKFGIGQEILFPNLTDLQGNRFRRSILLFECRWR